MVAVFVSRLLSWYDQHAADLPWRSTTQPYPIWLSEIMLQQTQVETVKPYYSRFLAAYPSVEDLAAAPVADVLKLWEGLGYYRRAHNLHKLAQIIAQERAGQFPTTAAEWQKLPGIGRYTAGAIASIAFGEGVPVLDGNVIRVFARLTDLTDDVTQASVRNQLWELAESWLPENRTGDYNQALMELGRTVCKPRQPDCEVCPLLAYCRSYRNGTQHERPVKKKADPTPHMDVTAGIIWNDDGQLLISQRLPEGLLGGLWEFPGGKVEPGETLTECLQRELREELGIEVEVGPLFVVVKHALSHYKLSLHTFTCRYLSGPPQKLEVQDWAWVEREALSHYAFGKADRKIIAALEERDQMLF